MSARYRDYAEALMDPDDADLPFAPDADWLARLGRVNLWPASITGKLRELAELADIAPGRPDAVTPEGALREIAAALRELAEELTNGR